MRARARARKIERGGERQRETESGGKTERETLRKRKSEKEIQRGWWCSSQLCSRALFARPL